MSIILTRHTNLSTRKQGSRHMRDAETDYALRIYLKGCWSVDHFVRHYLVLRHIANLLEGSWTILGVVLSSCQIMLLMKSVFSFSDR